MLFRSKNKDPTSQGQGVVQAVDPQLSKAAPVPSQFRHDLKKVVDSEAPRSHQLHQLFAKVLAFEQTQESFGRGCQSMRDSFSVFQLP